MEIPVSLFICGPTRIVDPKAAQHVSSRVISRLIYVASINKYIRFPISSLFLLDISFVSIIILSFPAAIGSPRSTFATHATLSHLPSRDIASLRNYFDSPDPDQTLAATLRSSDRLR